MPVAERRYDEAVSVIDRLLKHLDATCPVKYTFLDGTPAPSDWLWHWCFGHDHELYDDIMALQGLDLHAR